MSEEKISRPEGTPSPIARCRMLKGMYQRECAEALGINLRTWQRYESGEQVPGIKTACRISMMLSVPVGELFGYPEYLPAGDKPTLLDQHIRFLNAEGRAKVADYARDLDASGLYDNHDAFQPRRATDAAETPRNRRGAGRI